MFTLWIRRLEKHPLLATVYTLAKQSAVYFLGTALIGIGNFVLLPIYTRHLGISAFGMYGLIEVTLLVVVTAAQLGVGVAYVRWFPETPPERQTELLATSSIVVTLASLAMGFLLVLAARWSGHSWLAGLGSQSWFLLPLVVFRSLQTLFFSVLQAWQRPGVYVAAAVVRLTLLALSGIWLVGWQGRGLSGVLESWMLADGTCFLILTAVCLRRARIRFNMALTRPMLAYSLPLVWTALLGLLLDASGRFFVARYQSLVEVGLYTVAVKLANIPTMVFLQPFANAWAGIAFPIARKPNAGITYTKILGYAFVLLMLVVAMMILFSSVLVRLVAGPSYASAVQILPVFLLPVVIRPLEYWSCMPLYLKYKTKWLSAIYTLGLAWCLGMGVLLVPRLGALGAGLAWFSTLTLGVILMTAIGRKHYSMPIDTRTLGFGASLWLLAVITRWGFQSFPSTTTLPASSAIAILLILASAVYFRRDFKMSRAVFAEEAYAD
jgi:O-antigen/teichoic acid export membrane protein